MTTALWMTVLLVFASGGSVVGVLSAHEAPHERIESGTVNHSADRRDSKQKTRLFGGTSDRLDTAELESTATIDAGKERSVSPTTPQTAETIAKVRAASYAVLKAQWKAYRDLPLTEPIDLSRLKELSGIKGDLGSDGSLGQMTYRRWLVQDHVWLSAFGRVRPPSIEQVGLLIISDYALYSKSEMRENVENYWLWWSPAPDSTESPHEQVLMRKMYEDLRSKFRPISTSMAMRKSVAEKLIGASAAKPLVKEEKPSKEGCAQFSYQIAPHHYACFTADLKKPDQFTYAGIHNVEDAEEQDRFGAGAYRFVLWLAD
jgi:hypothetical protein